MLVFPRDDKFEVLPFFWCPEEGVLRRERRDRVPYTQWTKQGLIEATPGEAIDHQDGFEIVAFGHGGDSAFGTPGISQSLKPQTSNTATNDSPFCKRSRVSRWKNSWIFSGRVDTWRAMTTSPFSSRSEIVICRAC